jgi:hypothetical protein
MTGEAELILTSERLVLRRLRVDDDRAHRNSPGVLVETPHL